MSDYLTSILTFLGLEDSALGTETSSIPFSNNAFIALDSTSRGTLKFRENLPATNSAL